MRFSRPAVLAAAALVIAACAGAGDDAATGDTAGAAAAADTQSVRVDLTAQNESGVTGNATFTAQGGSVAVAAHVMGAEGEFVGQVHRGTCASLAQASTPVADLGAVTVSSGGMANHTATVSFALDSLANGQHAIVFRRGADGPVVACADIPRSGP